MEGYGTRERMLTTMGVVKNIKSPNLLYILGHIDNIFVQQIKYIIKLLWLQWLLKNLGVSTFFTTHFYCNNQSAIHITCNDVFHERIKHIKINCHFISYHLVYGALKLISISSQDQLTDIFTQSHLKGCLCTLVDNLKLVSHPPWVWRELLTCNRLVSFRSTLLVLFSIHTYTTHLPTI